MNQQSVALTILLLNCYCCIFINGFVNPSPKKVRRVIIVYSHSYQHRRHFLLQIISANLLLASPYVSSAANLPQDNGATLTKTGQVDTLIPIVGMKSSVMKANSVLSSIDGDEVSSKTCKEVLAKLKEIIPRDEKTFKRLFDEYSTPVNYKQKFLDQNAFLVYYSKGFDGADRPNIEDDINSIQTMQYGARNEVWTAMDDLLVELEYGAKSDGDGDEKDELLSLIGTVLKAMNSYLSLAPAADVAEAFRRITE